MSISEFTIAERKLVSHALTDYNTNLKLFNYKLFNLWFPKLYIYSSNYLELHLDIPPRGPSFII